MYDDEPEARKHGRRVRDWPKILSSASQSKKVDDNLLTQKLHVFSEKIFSFSPCGVCKANMMGSHYVCNECGLVTHQKCRESAQNTCGSVGLIRLKLIYDEHVVLGLDKYTEMTSSLKEDSFAIPALFGKCSADREELAKYLVN